MRWNPALAPVCPDATTIATIKILTIPRSRDLGKFEQGQQENILGLHSVRSIGNPMIRGGREIIGIWNLSGNGLDVRNNPV